jgi:hypothetical protein
MRLSEIYMTLNESEIQFLNESTKLLMPDLRKV